VHLSKFILDLFISYHKLYIEDDAKLRHLQKRDIPMISLFSQFATA
jgi:hypothetical protein